MKPQANISLSATRVLAAITLLLTFALPVQAAAVLSLKGTSTEARTASDAELRLSVLSYNDQDATSNFISRFKEYQLNQNHEEFGQFLKEQQTRGYLFSREATGYTIKYAWQDPAAPEKRMVFVVSPALKTLNPYLWKTRNDSSAPFTVLEMSYDGETAVVKTSLNAEVEVPADGNSLRLKAADSVEPFATLQDNTPYYLKNRS